MEKLQLILQEKKNVEKKIFKEESKIEKE